VHHHPLGAAPSPPSPHPPPENAMTSRMMKLPMMMVAGRWSLVAPRWEQGSGSGKLKTENWRPKAEAQANGNANADEDDCAGDTIMPPLIFWHD